MIGLCDFRPSCKGPFGRFKVVAWVKQDGSNNGKSWVIKTFLCESNSANVKLDHENVEFKWINYKDLKKYPTVPGLKKDLKVLNLI